MANTHQPDEITTGPAGTLMFTASLHGVGYPDAQGATVGSYRAQLAELLDLGYDVLQVLAPARAA